MWRRVLLGYLAATLVSIAGTGYLLVLAVNATRAWMDGSAPGEGQLWTTLATLMFGCASVLWRNIGSEPRGRFR